MHRTRPCAPSKPVSPPLVLLCLVVCSSWSNSRLNVVAILVNIPIVALLHACRRGFAALVCTDCSRCTSGGKRPHRGRATADRRCCRYLLMARMSSCAPLSPLYWVGVNHVSVTWSTYLPACGRPPSATFSRRNTSRPYRSASWPCRNGAAHRASTHFPHCAGRLPSTRSVEAFSCVTGMQETRKPRCGEERPTPVVPSWSPLAYVQCRWPPSAWISLTRTWTSWMSLTTLCGRCFAIIPLRGWTTVINIRVSFPGLATRPWDPEVNRKKTRSWHVPEPGAPTSGYRRLIPLGSCIGRSTCRREAQFGNPSSA